MGGSAVLGELKRNSPRLCLAARYSALIEHFKTDAYLFVLVIPRNGCNSVSQQLSSFDNSAIGQCQKHS